MLTGSSDATVVTGSKEGSEDGGGDSEAGSEAEVMRGVVPSLWRGDAGDGGARRLSRGGDRAVSMLVDGK